MSDRAAIVGGGPAGLTQARVLDALGIDYVLFERNADFGGLWNPDDPQSPLYDSAHLISSRTMTGFEGYPMPGHWADYPSGKHVLRYIRQFAKDYGIDRKTRFNTTVTRAEPVEGGWQVTTDDGKTQTFRWLIAANGSNWKPMTPRCPAGLPAPCAMRPRSNRRMN